jgi:hypothetical protein
LSAREGKGRDRERRTIKEKKNSAVVPWTADGAKQKLLSLSQKKQDLPAAPNEASEATRASEAMKRMAGGREKTS